MPQEKDDPQSAYSVRLRNTRFEICAVSGRTILVCEDEDSASHYVSLLNEAHRAGYKSGYREGRKNSLKA